MDNNSCRICLDNENLFSNPLISPCLCKGSMKYIHRECLNSWRKSNNKAYYMCDICKYEYKFMRTTIANILRNELVIHIITLFTFIIISSLIGLFINRYHNIRLSTISSYFVYNLIMGSMIMGMFGFMTLFISMVINLPWYVYNSIRPPSTKNYNNGMIIIMIIIGIGYVLYNTYKIIRFIVDYNLGKIEHLIENVN
jgi:hypothetical protein